MRQRASYFFFSFTYASLRTRPLTRAVTGDLRATK